MSENCLFCKIASGKIPSKKVYEDDLIFSFMDVNPLEFGHVLVIPKRHNQYFSGLTDDEASAVFKFAKKVSTLLRTDSVLKKEFNCQATSICVNNGPEAGQTVPHFHLHVIPRSKEDEGKHYGQTWNPIKNAPFGQPELLEEHMKLLESHSKMMKEKI